MTKICPKCRVIAMDFELKCSICDIPLEYFKEWWEKNKDKR